MNLKGILDKTKKSLKDNNAIVEQQAKQKEQEKESRRTTEYDIDSREVKMILSLGLTIDEFEPQDPKDGYWDAREYYYCSNDRWKVDIRNLLYDADLGTILQVLKLTDKTTGKEVDFYCDLWCQNTGTNKLEQLKYLLNHTYKEYINNEFGHYFILPELLRTKGFNVIENNFIFDTYKCLGYLEISSPRNNKVKSYLKISHDYGIYITLNSKIKGDSLFDKNICYSIKYKDKRDIDLITDVVNKHLEHIEGKVGYLENGQYYTNEDVENIFCKYERKFDSLTDMTKGYRYWNYDEEQTQEEIDEYNKMCELVEINHYKGAEIYKKYEITINRNAYHFGGIGNDYEFEIIYNLNINKNNCILNIKHTNTEYVGRNNVLYDDSLQNEINQEINTYSTDGSFLHIKNTLIQFLDELSKISKDCE